jgi:LPS export ABC transporter protein LptC
MMRRFCLILVMGGVALTSGCGRRPPEVSRTTSGTRPPLRATTERPHITLADPQGRRIWDGRAQTMEIDEGSRSALLRQVESEFLENNRLVLRATAGKVRVDYQARTVTLTRGVRVESPVTGATMTVERLTWRADDHRLVGEGGVAFTRRNVRVTAPRLEADTALRRVRLGGGATLVAEQSR